MFCETCGQPIDQTGKFCTFCGASVGEPLPQTGQCSGCGAKVNPGQHFCGQCGLGQLNQEPSQIPLQPQPVRCMDPPQSGYAPRPASNQGIIIALVLAAVFVFFLWSQKKEAPAYKNTPVPTTAAAQTEELQLAGNWWDSTKTVGLMFSKNGNLRLKVKQVTVGGNLLQYEVIDDDTMYIGIDVNLVVNAGVGVDVSYHVSNDELTIDLGEIVQLLSSQSGYNPALDSLSSYKSITLWRE